ncbi:protein PELOTA 1-like [Triticum urartu]|uniref:Protein pelota homolog n=1 Tax=Triticum urartu TaxID=4572 RepID=A0A8R7QV34_TRIUA|nr:protein PELOTA 1-like [Triticum urartu]
MKLVGKSGKSLARDGPGSVKLVPEVDDDLWDAYNLIAAGDAVEAVTVRKITKSWGRTSERVKLTLGIAVESTDYDKEGSVLRVRGKNLSKNEHVQIGQYHTLEIELRRPFLLRKEAWDWPALDTIRKSCDETGANADLAVLLMQEGLAHLFLVGRSVTATRARVEVPIPRKHGSGAVAAYDTALKDFFHRVLDAFVKHVDFDLVQCVVIASPGFTKDQFRDYMLLEAARRGELRAITEHKARIVLASAPSGYPHSLKDVLAAPGVMSLIKDTRAAQEVPALQEFFAMITKDSARACYGPKHVEVAHERLAIQTLLLTDTWFRNPDVAARRKCVDLAESVKKIGGQVRVFSSMHVSGNQLEQLTGIAAVLRFPMPDLDDIEM